MYMMWCISLTKSNRIKGNQIHEHETIVEIEWMSSIIDNNVTRDVIIILLIKNNTFWNELLWSLKVIINITKSSILEVVFVILGHEY